MQFLCADLVTVPTCERWSTKAMNRKKQHILCSTFDHLCYVLLRHYLSQQRLLQYYMPGKIY